MYILYNNSFQILILRQEFQSEYFAGPLCLNMVTNYYFKII